MNIPFRNHPYCDASNHLLDNKRKSFSISKNAKLIYKLKDSKEIDRFLKPSLVVYRKISERTPVSDMQQCDRVFKVLSMYYKTIC